MKELKELFFKLRDIGAPSGFEEPMMIAVKSELNILVDEVMDTPRGNVIGIKKGTDRKTLSVALVSHMDQIGFIVFYIDESGFIRFRKLGEVATRAILGQQVRILTYKGSVMGVIGLKPGHITKPEEDRVIPPIEDMYIDVGAKSREEVEKLGVTVGTPIVYNTQPIELVNNLISSPSVDDRVGCTALITVAKALKDVKLPATVYFVFSVEEEEGLRGAEVALYDLEVDMAVAIDTSPAGWQPDVPTKDIFYQIGKGPGIHVAETGGGRTTIEHHKVRRWLIETAKQEGIPYQTGIMSGHADATALMQTRTGIPTAVLGLPRRYSHSPIEVFDLNDLNNLVRILIAALRKLDANFNLHRI